MTESEKIREFFKANPQFTVKDAAKEFPNSHSSNIYKLRAQALGLVRKTIKKKKVVKVKPGIEVVRNVIKEQTKTEEELVKCIHSLNEELEDMAKSVLKARDEVKGYQVLISYFEWQIGLRDSQAGHRGSPV
jgi:hypothetical protein